MIGRSVIARELSEPSNLRKISSPQQKRKKKYTRIRARIHQAISSTFGMKDG